jgi:sugar phosphate isomerase/epimerase
VDRVADWVAIAEEYGVVVAVKPHRGHAMSRPSEAAWLISQLDHSKALRMWYDYSHFIFRDIPLKHSLQQSLPIMAGVAVKDAIEKEGKVQFLLPGAAGTIDYDLLCNILQEGNFSGSLCVEVSSHVWKRPDYDPTVAMRKSYGVLSSAIGGKNSSRVR